MPASAGYLWRNLAYHVDGAGQSTELPVIVATPEWILAKVRQYGPVALAEDLVLVDTETSRELRRFLDQMGYLFVPGTLDHAVVNALAQRLPGTPALTPIREAAAASTHEFARLVAIGPMPGRPDPALERVLVGEDGVTSACVFGSDETWLVSKSWNALRVWSPDSGRLIRLVDVDTGFLGTGVRHAVVEDHPPLRGRVGPYLALLAPGQSAAEVEELVIS